MDPGAAAGAGLAALGLAWGALVFTSRRASLTRMERADSGAPLAMALQWAARSQGKALTIAAAMLVTGALLLLIG